ncbi:DUF58 domain-containing protein [Marinoscillum furvescens]|uniref:Uncharacterized protein DUF58 n=1 Tax=Marinoscillum furvescens DSM 4134 TaxID=1122208 RepID=A0A3D9L5M6_MARFU|nr:DUF58 domain-containing protein [Marinoscillum furvescens]REE01219.1 uncharacterized protein DUF58 [Marinoscillum furvescens DSM 4134]
MNIRLSDIRQFEHLDLLAKQLVEGFITGLHKSPYHGFSVEFAEHKLYNFGESTRHVDWKVYGRTDRLYTKRYEEETNLRAHLLIDVSSSMYYPAHSQSKIRFSAVCAAALAYLLTKQRDAVGLTTFADKVVYQSALKSTKTHLNQLLTSLGQTLDNQGVPQTDVAKVLHEIADRIHKRSLVIIFSDMFQQANDLEAIFAALQHLKHNKHEVLIFHVTDQKTELGFEFEDRPHQFIDLETKERIKLNPGEVKSAYQEQMKKLYHELKIRCGTYKIDLVEADVQEPFEKILGAYLIKRKRMK